MTYGWIRDAEDSRDFQYKAVLNLLPLPSKVDLRDKYDAVYDQGQIGSCTANAIAMAIDFERVKQGLQPLLPSRLFIYYNERAIEGNIHSDSGAQIRDGIKSITVQGVCPETDWPYKENNLTLLPSPKCYAEAKTDIVQQYLSIDNNLNDMKSCLAAGFPFVFGFTVYDNFESEETAKTGILTMPLFHEMRCFGCHAVIAVGYDDEKKQFIIRNSWGKDWGDKGHFYMPYAYAEDKQLADDFWSIRLV